MEHLPTTTSPNINGIGKECPTLSTQSHSTTQSDKEEPPISISDPHPKAVRQVVEHKHSSITALPDTDAVDEECPASSTQSHSTTQSDMKEPLSTIISGAHLEISKHTNEEKTGDTRTPEDLQNKTSAKLAKKGLVYPAKNIVLADTDIEGSISVIDHLSKQDIQFAIGITPDY